MTADTSGPPDTFSFRRDADTARATAALLAAGGEAWLSSVTMCEGYLPKDVRNRMIEKARVHIQAIAESAGGHYVSGGIKSTPLVWSSDPEKPGLRPAEPGEEPDMIEVRLSGRAVPRTPLPGPPLY